MRPLVIVFAAACTTAHPPDNAGDAGTSQVDQPGACPDRSSAKNVYWGDLHAHTSYSLDAYTTGNRADPMAAFAYARQQAAVPLENGAAGQSTIDRKLDFLTVTDHSEFLDAMQDCIFDASPSNPHYNTDYCASLRALDPQVTGALGAQVLRTDPQRPPVCRGTPADEAQCTFERQSAWQREQMAANLAYQRCSFTTFPAYEWTATTGGLNFHRNVIFANEHVPDEPIDYIAQPTVQGLWNKLAETCTDGAGCDAITIPHNSNLSRGQMFDTSAFTATDVQHMNRYQLLAEVFQGKGNSECASDPVDDPFCQFELIGGTLAVHHRGANADEKPAFMRHAMAASLAGPREKLLQLGFVGATDTHDSTPGNVVEKTCTDGAGNKVACWPGHHGNGDATSAARLDRGPGQNFMFNPGAITGVWAEENTRESVYGALERRETFATSGPRIPVRFYATWRTSPSPCSDMPAGMAGSPLSTPMGGKIDVAAGAPGQMPMFVVSAAKDLSNIARIDIVKASYGADGAVHEQVQQIFDGGISDPLRCVEHNTQAGAPSACVTWTDPAWDKAQPAFYYARVFEEPTCRWSHYDCETVRATVPDWRTRFPGCDRAACAASTQGCLDVSVQERAWTSPIWSLP